jgi:transposase
MQALGNEVRLIAPQEVTPYDMRQKKHATDAEARQPEVHFHSPKSEELQARAAIFRAREIFEHQQIE